MLKAHNTFVDEARLAGAGDDHVFDEATRQLRWHYQWIVLNEFLPALVGQSLADAGASRRPAMVSPWSRTDLYPSSLRMQPIGTATPDSSPLPIELHVDPVPLFPDLLGFRPVPRQHTIDWTLFFDAPGAEPAQRCKKIDGKLVRALIELPVAVTGECEIEDYHSLAVRDLQRGQGAGLPSGEAVARHIGIVPLTEEQVGLTSTGWHGETPLWFYILREADACTGGHCLGPVGGRIVTEVLVGLYGCRLHIVSSGRPKMAPQKNT